ncbi:hypothetical protein ACFYP6_29550 [Streptomyces goshikiensis]|uniref:hypothetical protein n=1 Tax=Streptomyces goshikiensis TaxID=1942 RepID=UPI003696FC4E
MNDFRVPIPELFAKACVAVLERFESLMEKPLSDPAGTGTGVPWSHLIAGALQGAAGVPAPVPDRLTHLAGEAGCDRRNRAVTGGLPGRPAATPPQTPAPAAATSPG